MSLVLFVATLVVNTLAAIGKIGGMTIKQISDLHSSAITPVPEAFSIWFVIYLWLAAALIYLFIKRKEKDRKVLNYLFWFSSLMNISWIISWQYQKMVLSFIFMLTLFISLMALLLETKEDNLLVSGAFGVYAGWINIAMLANLFAVIGSSSMFWVITAMVLCAVQIALMLVASENVFYAIGSAWGLFGIMLAGSLIIQISSAILAIALIVLAVYLKMRKTSI